ncbi:fungal pheromone mating factor STE2 GPCR-domain-containing protein [Geopyxis carbonaria]|nr:fungal pheromone mating factor STE2 GPCR-domain-containing protein [Geopyxis carbonaria]
MSNESIDPMGPVPGSEFDVHRQPLTILMKDGTNFTIGLDELNGVNLSALRLCIIFASQIGAGAVLICFVLMLTRPSRRYTAICLFNLLALGLVVVRSMLQILFWLGSWFDMYSYLSGDFSDVASRDREISVCAACMAFFLEICIEASLILQVLVIFKGHTGWKGWVAIWTSGILGMVALGFFAVATYQNSINSLKGESYDGNWVYPTAKVTFAASISTFSGIFIWKLGLSIISRKSMGVEGGASALNIIFAMGLQTMIIPAGFAITEYFVKFDGMGSFVATFVAVSLPLSTMWAQSIHTIPDSTGKDTSWAKKLSTGDSISQSSSSTLVASNNHWNEKQHWPMKQINSRGLTVSVDRDFEVQSSHGDHSPEPSPGLNGPAISPHLMPRLEIKEERDHFVNII